jgi:hypothetical protein
MLLFWLAYYYVPRREDVDMTAAAANAKSRGSANARKVRQFVTPEGVDLAAPKIASAGLRLGALTRSIMIADPARAAPLHPA